MRKPTAKTFNAWFDRNLRESARDIANHGADAGYPHITYTSDCCTVFDAYANEIWARAVSAAEDQGVSVCEMIAGFGRSDMADDWNTFRNLMLWFACEERAHELES